MSSATDAHDPAIAYESHQQACPRTTFALALARLKLTKANTKNGFLGSAEGPAELKLTQL
jgi:hypothetical protein